MTVRHRGSQTGEVEEALKGSEERFRAIVENAPFGYYRVGNDGLWQYVNPVWERMHGYSAKDVIGKRFEITQTGEDIEAARQNVKRALAGETITGEFSRATGRGTTEYHTFNIQPVRHGGEIVAIEGFINDITERKRAEEALQKSVRLLRDTGEMAKVGGWELDLSTKEVSWTEEVCRIHGVEPGYRPKLEEAFSFYSPESRPAIEAAVKKAAETGEPWDLESLFIPLGSKDKIWVRSLGKAVYSGGKIVKVAGTFQNIDKHKRADEALRESEKRFRQVLDVSSDLVYKLDLESGTFDYVSPSVQPLTGFTPEEVIAMGFRGIRHVIHPEDWPQYRRGINEFTEIASRDGAPRRYEYRWQCKDGQYRWFSESRTLVRDAEGRPVAVVGAIRDVTERRAREEALRESEERFRSLSAAAPIGIMLIDNKDGTVYCNKRFLSIFGLPKEEAMGFGWARSLHPDDREAFLDERSKAMAEGREFIREFRVVAPQGETRWLNVHTTPLLSQERVSNSRVGTLEDITERKQAVERDRQLHAEHIRANELRHMVRILEQMAATLGHELRNPLGVISNSAYFLANQAQINDPKAQKHVEIISHEVTSARRVIDDILEFAHVPEILPSPASLNAIVDQALARSQVPANIRVTRKLAVDLPPVVCDEERLERGFLDVITNAVQAMPHGGRLSVKTRRSGDGVAAAFADTGEGIAPQNLAKIFDPMFTTKLRGLGLGLTVVRRTVEQHGGRVEVRSVLGHGTTVTIMLPVDCRSAQSNDEALAKRPGRGAAEREEQSRETAAVSGAEQ